MWQTLANDQLIQLMAGVALFIFIIYLLAHALYETWERNRVVEAAKKWAENKERRNQRETARELWDSVEQLKRGQKEQKSEY